jgi:hypothetical protein
MFIFENKQNKALCQLAEWPVSHEILSEWADLPTSDSTRHCGRYIGRSQLQEAVFTMPFNTGDAHGQQLGSKRSGKAKGQEIQHLPFSLRKLSRLMAGFGLIGEGIIETAKVKGCGAQEAEGIPLEGKTFFRTGKAESHQPARRQPDGKAYPASKTEFARLTHDPPLNFGDPPSLNLLP